MLYGLAVILVIIWLVSWLGLHVASGLIHLLLLFALISIIISLVTGRRA